MIRETLDILANPFFAQGREAEDRWDNRFKDTESTCPRCQGTGWLEISNVGDWFRCNRCQGGTIYTALCSRCGKSESGCFCIVEDFR